MSADKIHPDSSSQASRQSSSADKSQTGCRACWPSLLTRVYLPFALISCFGMTFLKYAHPPFSPLCEHSVSFSFKCGDWSTLVEMHICCISTKCVHVYRYASSLISYITFEQKAFLHTARMIKPSSTRAFLKHWHIVSSLGNVRPQPLCTFYYESIVRGNSICCDWPLHSGSNLSVSSLLVMHWVTRKLWLDGPTFRQPAGGQCSLNTPLCRPTAGKQYQRCGWTWGKAFIFPPAAWEPTGSPHRSVSPSNYQHLVRSAHGKRVQAVSGWCDIQRWLLLFFSFF